MDKYSKYVDLAKQNGMTNALVISPSEIFFDIRANLKCAWGCERQAVASLKCDSRGTTYEQRVQMVNQYRAILLMHCHDARKLSETILELERIAFLDGYYFAFALRACNLCKECQVLKGKDCPRPDKIRPCDQMFGIDTYKTARALGLPCEVLQTRDAIQNRYGFLFIE